MTPIFDRLVEKYNSEDITGLKAELYLRDWYHDRGYRLATSTNND